MRSGKSESIKTELDQSDSMGQTLLEIGSDDIVDKNPTGPFLPFLDPYLYSDGEKLFGRDQQRTALASHIKTGSPSLSIIHGPSGAGKSSFLNAVVIPNLIVGGYQVFTETVLKKRGRLPSESVQFWGSLKASAKRAIIVDQTEEIFTLSESSVIADFFDRLREQLNDVSILVFLAVRKEFFSDLVGAVESRNLAYRSVHVPRLTTDSAMQTISTAARLSSLKFQDGLASQILIDLENRVDDRVSIDPPQLQIVLETLFRSVWVDVCEPTVITRQKYDETGGVAGMLRNFFSDRLASYSNDQRNFAKSILKRMVTEAGTRKPFTPSDINDLSARIGKSNVQVTLRRLLEDRLVREVAEVSGSEIHFELVHEYLVTPISMWIDDKETAVRLLNGQLERHFGLLDVKMARAPLSRQQLLAYVRELQTELLADAGRIDSISSMAMQVMLASALRHRQISEAEWIVSIMRERVAVSITAEILFAFSAPAKLIFDLDCLTHLDDQQLASCADFSLKYGGSSLSFWTYDERGRRVIASRLNSFLKMQIDRQIYQRCKLLRGVLTNKWTIQDFNDPRYAGTVLDELRIFTQSPPIVQATRELRKFLLSDFATIPGGKLSNGKSVKEFQLQRTPVTNGQFREFVHSGGYTTQLEKLWTKEGLAWLLSTKAHSPDERFWKSPLFSHADQPVVGVCLYEAIAYCNYVGGRLPTEYEWHRAAQGDTDFLYPWGNEVSEEYCLVSSDDEVPAPVRVAIYPRGASPYGIFDLSGNVWEWTSSKSEETGLFVLRGGSLQLNQGVGKISSRSFREANDRYYFRGFRVAKDL